MVNDCVFEKVLDLSSYEKRRREPEDTNRYFGLTKEFLTQERRMPVDGLTIVMTHHAPSIRSRPDQERKAVWTPCDASSLDILIEELQRDLWSHGHIHVPNDYRISKTRIVSNPRGYVPGDVNPNFDPELVIEI